MIKILISPSKTQNDKVQSNKSYLDDTIPYFQNISFKINELLVKYEKNELFWKELEIKNNNDKLKKQTLDNIRNFNKFKYQAILKYSGLQYKNLDFFNLNEIQQNNLNNNLYIMSAYYGLLKPSDLISSYRLMLNSKFKYNNLLLKNFWKDKLTNYFLENNIDSILNLASDEYGYAIDKSKINCINISFLISKNNKLSNCATNAKICRGKMINLISNYENIELKTIKSLIVNDHKYNETLSTNNLIVFTK